MDWLAHPVRTCDGCGFGISERLDIARPILRRLQVPIDIARLVLVPVIVLLTGLTAAFACMQLANDTTITRPPLSIAISILAGFGILGGLVVVLAAPHQPARTTGAVWILVVAFAVLIVISVAIVDQGRNLLREIDFGRLAGGSLLISLAGLFATYPITMVRERLFKSTPARHDGDDA